MSARRHTRSMRSNSGGSKPPKTTSTHNISNKRTPKHIPSPNDLQTSPKSSSSTISVPSIKTDSQISVGAGGSSAAADEQDTDKTDGTQPDVHALPSVSETVRESDDLTPMTIEDAAHSSTKGQELWAGRNDQLNEEDVMHLDNFTTTVVPSIETAADSIQPTFDTSFRRSSVLSDAHLEADADFVVADDDDDYDGVDKVSVTSEGSENFEKHVEQEIIAGGEDKVDWEPDWDDANTYTYNDSWNENQFILDIDFDAAFSVMERHMFPVNRRKESATPSAREKEIFVENLRRVSFAEHRAESDSSDAAGLKPENSNTPSHASRLDICEIHAMIEESTDDEGLNTTITSPAVTLSRRSSAKSQSSASVKRTNRKCPKRKQPDLPVLRRFVLDPTKAVSCTTLTPDGKKRVYFREAKKVPFPWVTIASSRNGSIINSPDPVIESSIADAINGRLFQQLHCNEDLTDVPIANTTEFARKPFLRPMLQRTPLQRPIAAPGGASGAYTASNADVEALALIDFDGGCSDVSISQELEATVLPKSDSTTTIDHAAKHESPPIAVMALPSPIESSSPDPQYTLYDRNDSNHTPSKNDSSHLAEDPYPGVTSSFSSFNHPQKTQDDVLQSSLDNLSPRKRRLSDMLEPHPDLSAILKRPRTEVSNGLCV